MVQMGQAAVYQLVLDRKVGEYELPKCASLIACGNRESDRVVGPPAQSQGDRGGRGMSEPPDIPKPRFQPGPPFMPTPSAASPEAVLPPGPPHTRKPLLRHVIKQILDAPKTSAEGRPITLAVSAFAPGDDVRRRETDSRTSRTILRLACRRSPRLPRCMGRPIGLLLPTLERAVWQTGR